MERRKIIFFAFQVLPPAIYVTGNRWPRAVGWESLLLGKLELSAAEIPNSWWHDNFRYLEINLLQPTGHYMHHQFNIQQLYALPTLYLCVLYLSENKQRLVPLTA